MSDYQLRAVDPNGEPFGVWCDVAGRKQFWTNGDHVLIRKKPVPRGAGWYQSTTRSFGRVDLSDVLHYNADPGESYRKMNVEPEEGAS